MTHPQRGWKRFLEHWITKQWDNQSVPLGVYISVPFCRTKCSYCNFASDVFSRAVFQKYVDRVCSDIANAPETAAMVGGRFERAVDSIYLGGGTPTLLESAQLERIFSAVRSNFEVSEGAEVTVECAPGTLSEATVQSLMRCGVNRVSLGVQSFVDQEAAAVGRQHRRSTVLEDVARLRDSGISNINIDLIAGLPHQTSESWTFSLQEVIAIGVPHVSVYMLEVDEDSRLGREVMAGGRRYHAHFVPDEESTASFYETACEHLCAAGILQYEISNFARESFESVHNLKYWTRQPYLGFGVDAHSMLLSESAVIDAVRFSPSDVLEKYMAGTNLERIEISREAAFEESFFLGLRLNRGVNLGEIESTFGKKVLGHTAPVISEFLGQKMLEREGDFLYLTPRGRLLSNEIFERFMLADDIAR